MKVFSKELFIKVEGASAVSAWVEACNGQEVVDGSIGQYTIRDEWCKEQGCACCRNEVYYEVIDLGNGYSKGRFLKDTTFKYCPECGSLLTNVLKKTG